MSSGLEAIYDEEFDPTFAAVARRLDGDIEDEDYEVRPPWEVDSEAVRHAIREEIGLEGREGFAADDPEGLARWEKDRRREALKSEVRLLLEREKYGEPIPGQPPSRPRLNGKKGERSAHREVWPFLTAVRTLRKRQIQDNGGRMRGILLTVLDAAQQGEPEDTILPSRRAREMQEIGLDPEDPILVEFFDLDQRRFNGLVRLALRDPKFINDVQERIGR